MSRKAVLKTALELNQRASNATSSDWVIVQADGASQPEIVRPAQLVADGAITEDKLAFGAVTVTKIGSNAVTHPKILAGNVLTDKIADLAVTNGKLAGGIDRAAKLTTFSDDYTTATAYNLGTSIGYPASATWSVPRTGRYHWGILAQFALVTQLGTAGSASIYVQAASGAGGWGAEHRIMTLTIPAELLSSAMIAHATISFGGCGYFYAGSRTAYLGARRWTDGPTISVARMNQAYFWIAEA